MAQNRFSLCIFGAATLLLPMAVMAQTVQVTDPCAALAAGSAGNDVAHVAAADVAYKEDSADPVTINAMPVSTQPIKIPVTVDLAARYGLGNLPAGMELKPEVASMEIFPDGKVTYNGQDISGQVQSACLNPPSAPPAPAEQQASGHMSKDGLLYGSDEDAPSGMAQETISGVDGKADIVTEQLPPPKPGDILSGGAN